MDDNYQTYVNRVVRMTLPETYISQLQHIQSSPKFQAQTPGGPRQAAPFPGFTVITPPGFEDDANVDLYKTLQHYQQQLLKELDPGLVVPVPPESFHLTLADMIWDSAYRHAAENPEFESQLCDRMGNIFRQTQAKVAGAEPIRWQVLGLLVMTRAVGVCLAPKGEQSYERILNFRRAIYQNPELMGLGIEQQYHLTAHVTLGYFGNLPVNTDQETDATHDFGIRLSDTFSQLNHQWLDSEPQEMVVARAELRKFDDMTRYYREPTWPVLEF